MPYTWTHAPFESFVRENLCLLELLVGGAIFGISRLAAVLPHPLPPLSHGLLSVCPCFCVSPYKDTSHWI